jgi:hypothetical protein
MGVLSGQKASMEIDGQAFNFGEIEWDAKFPDLEVPGSEGKTGGGNSGQTGFMASVSGLGKLTLKITQMSLDNEDNPYDTFTIDPDARYKVEIFPEDGVTDSYWVDALMITGLGTKITVAGSQPVTIEGVSDGAFSFPGASQATSR